MGNDINWGYKTERGKPTLQSLASHAFLTFFLFEGLQKKSLLRYTLEEYFEIDAQMKLVDFKVRIIFIWFNLPLQ